MENDSELNSHTQRWSDWEKQPSDLTARAPMCVCVCAERTLPGQPCYQWSRLCGTSAAGGSACAARLLRPVCGAEEPASPSHTAALSGHAGPALPLLLLLSL